MDKKEHVLLKKSLYTVVILLLYILGKNIPLYGVDLDAYTNIDIDAQAVFLQSLSGDFKNASIFIMGLWPYMISSMILMVYMAIKSSNKTNKISPKKMKKLNNEFMLIIGVIYAIYKISGFKYKAVGTDLILVKCIVFVELIAGMLIVINMCSRNEKYGIGGRTSIFLVNIVSGIRTMIQNQTGKELLIPLCIAVVEIAVMLILETTEKRVPVQRVSINNIYADKNYIAYKLNPAGVMPLMFSSAVFMLPQMIFGMLAMYFPENERLVFIGSHMVMSSTVGVVTYIIIVWVLTISFSQLMLQPWKMAEQLMKAGDSILDIYAGKPTKKYLVHSVLRFSIISSIILSICIGVPLVLQLYGYISPSVVMLPVSVMMSTGIWITLYRESIVYKNMDSYKPFV